MGFGTVAGCKVVVTKTGSDEEQNVVYTFSGNDATVLAQKIKDVRANLVGENEIFSIPKVVGWLFGTKRVEAQESFAIRKNELIGKTTKSTSPAAAIQQELEKIANIQVITI